MFDVGRSSQVLGEDEKSYYVKSKLTDGCHVLDGAVRTGVLVSGDRALLIDCCDTVNAARLAELGVESVEMILCTQFRRPHTAGVYSFIEEGTQLIAPQAERELFEHPEKYWNDPANRWHLYHHRPGPLVPVKPMRVYRTVQEGDVIEWEGFAIRVLETTGPTDGSVSYVVETRGKKLCFSGNIILARGQIPDIYSLQKHEGDFGDYHGFMGARKELRAGLDKLLCEHPDTLVPSIGPIIEDPPAAIALLQQRLDAVWQNYAALSCMHYYSPGLLDEPGQEPSNLLDTGSSPPPDFIRHGEYTSFALFSETGAILLTDCGNELVVDQVKQWMDEGVISALDLCFITHYHDDHVNALVQLREAFDCPVAACEQQAEIIEHPERFFLPCIAPVSTRVDRKTKDGESWNWHEFKLTAYHLPGQTFYHGGLLVEGRGGRYFLSGDSGGPKGIDDHCCQNRVFLGKSRGFRRCVELWREADADLIFNSHQFGGFHYGSDELDCIDRVLEEREALCRELLPWPDPNFGLDENWVHTYPYEQDVEPGASFSVDVRFTNHGAESVVADVEPVLPDGWLWDEARSGSKVTVPAHTDGSTEAFTKNPDKAASVCVGVPADATDGKYVIPFRVTWGDRYLGQFRCAIVNVGQA